LGLSRTGRFFLTKKSRSVATTQPGISLALENSHLFLGESTAINIPYGATRLLGPVVWPAVQIPDPASWHPCNEQFFCHLESGEGNIACHPGL
jgi:hypothetical protein